MSDKLAERIIIVLTVIWLAVVVILSAILRDFQWFGAPWESKLGPASIVSICGIVIIFAATLGVRWIYREIHKDK